MDVGLILKVAGIGILVSVSAQVLSKSGRDEQAMMVTIAGLIVVLVMIVTELGELFSLIRSVFGF
ncbi:MAG: stage III sporulation protein AC [Clostridia bacterium]|nr:stage III sporulation protein AC [Clostridia bacterium]MDY3784590.1 stage III sporulation protein AC [Eubacteriales bacterium]